MTEKIYSYFPGCSMATTAKENNASLSHLVSAMGITLVELKDWNCCGSSSAHSIDRDLADHLAMRNLSLAPDDRPLLVACPSCNLRLQHAQCKLSTDETARVRYKELFGREPNRNLQIIHLFEVLDQVDWRSFSQFRPTALYGMKIAFYYGCMLARPPALAHSNNHHGLMESILTRLGAFACNWGYATRCCGTFLSVVRPDIVSPMVQEIIDDAMRSGADCIVTACAMCHMNLEVRGTPDLQLPIFHLTELLSMAFCDSDPDSYFNRHLIDPRPYMKRHQSTQGQGNRVSGENMHSYKNRN